MAASDPAAFVRPRARLVGRAAAAGAGCGTLSLVVLAPVVGSRVVASEKAFAVGALLLGFGLLGWSGSLMAADGFEAMRRHLHVATDWTETKSRRAMARIGGFGAGWMAGVTVVTALLVG